ncbi:hypothetical protein MRB53_037174 [Persea americana]|nr:hypothetical protein MRB53_037174 [Persea americana]
MPATAALRRVRFVFVSRRRLRLTHYMPAGERIRSARCDSQRRRERICTFRMLVVDGRQTLCQSGRILLRRGLRLTRTSRK